MASSSGSSYWQQIAIRYDDGMEITTTLAEPQVRLLQEQGPEGKALMEQIRKSVMEGQLEEVVDMRPTEGTSGETPGGASGGASGEMPGTSAVGMEVPASQQPNQPDENDDLACEENKAVWSDEATKCLIALYKEHQEEMDNPRKKCGDVWAKIAKRLEEAGFRMTNIRQRAEQKWRNLTKSHKNFITNRKTTGRGRKTFVYFELMDDVVGKRHDINPPMLGGNNLTITPIEPSSPVQNPPVQNSNDDAEVPSTSVVSPSMSASAKKRREKRKLEAEDDVSTQTLKLLKGMEESRKAEAAEKSAREERKLALFEKMLETFKN